MKPKQNTDFTIQVHFDLILICVFDFKCPSRYIFNKYKYYLYYMLIFHVQSFFLFWAGKFQQVLWYPSYSFVIAGYSDCGSNTDNIEVRHGWNDQNRNTEACLSPCKSPSATNRERITFSSCSIRWVSRLLVFEIWCDCHGGMGFFFKLISWSQYL